MSDYFYKQILTNGISPSTRRAHRRDMAYFWTWVQNTLDKNEHYPISKDILIQFVISHLRGDNCRKLKVTTIRRYLSSLSSHQNTIGVDNTCRHDQIKFLLRRARVSQCQITPIKKQAITSAMLKSILYSCEDSIRGIRDKAILLVSFSSGGRRRSELSSLMLEDLFPIKGGYQWIVRRSKTDQARKGYVVPILGEAAKVIKEWLKASDIKTGKLFRSINRHGAVGTSLSGHSINTIIKKRIENIGINPMDYGSHSLRAGFMTEACNQGISLPVAMALSGHSSIDVAAKYYRHGEITNNPAAYLLGENT